MKKIFKTLAVCAVAGTLMAGTMALAGCGDKEETYFGQYHYTSYGHEYGIAVNVTVNGDKIKKVEKVTSNYVEVSSPVSTWTEANVTAWNNGVAGLLAKYEGKTVAAVKDATATISGVADAKENKVSDSDLVLTGATQGSARILKAVQDALTNKAAAAKVVEGEYHYTSYGHEYGFKVSVSVVDGKIFGVNKVASDYVEVSSPVSTWTEENVATWNNGIAGLLAAYSGKTVDAVKAATSSIKGVDEATANSVSDSTLVITGATQGSARVLKAVQDALSKL